MGGKGKLDMAFGLMPLRIPAMLAGMTRRVFVAAALAGAVLLTWLAWDGWFQLQRGYTLRVRMAGEAGSIFRTDFPPWRTAVHVLLWVAAMASTGAYVAGRRWASTAAWLTFAATMIIGIYDVVQYGTTGSPTSIWTVLLLLLLALLTSFGPLAPGPEA